MRVLATVSINLFLNLGKELAKEFAIHKQNVNYHQRRECTRLSPQLNMYEMTKYPSGVRDSWGHTRICTRYWGTLHATLTYKDHCGLCIFRDFLHQLQVFTMALRVMKMWVFLSGKNTNT